MVKLIKYTDPLGFQVTEVRFTKEDGTVCRRLSTVEGSGTVFYIPDGITSIVGGFYDAENLKKIFIPASVKDIGFGSFRHYDDSVDIYCEAPEKPEGFAEGEFIEYFEEEYVFYEGDTWYGNWLTNGTQGGRSREEVDAGIGLPRVHWGARKEDLAGD